MVRIMTVCEGALSTVTMFKVVVTVRAHWDCEWPIRLFFLSASVSPLPKYSVGIAKCTTSEQMDHMRQIKMMNLSITKNHIHLCVCVPSNAAMVI